MGAFYYDPAMMYAFNRATGLMKTGFDNDATRKKLYRRLWPSEYKLFTYRSFPRIHPRTARLEWWVDRETHQRIMGNVPYGSMDLDD